MRQPRRLTRARCNLQLCPCALPQCIYDPTPSPTRRGVDNVWPKLGSLWWWGGLSSRVGDRYPTACGGRVRLNCILELDGFLHCECLPRVLLLTGMKDLGRECCQFSRGPTTSAPPPRFPRFVGYPEPTPVKQALASPPGHKCSPGPSSHIPVIFGRRISSFRINSQVSSLARGSYRLRDGLMERFAAA